MQRSDIAKAVELDRHLDRLQIARDQFTKCLSAGMELTVFRFAGPDGLVDIDVQALFSKDAVFASVQVLTEAIDVQTATAEASVASIK